MAYTFQHGDRPLDDFTIQRAVGRGGFGEVYYAISDGGREVALKYLRDNPHIELRGVANCINLKSPHLVSIFDVKKSSDGDYFIVMEYAGGPSLRDLLIAEPNGLGPQKSAFFMREIGKGLAYLHDRGIVHRDLKPGNIFYDEGYVKIGDYGLSKFISISRHSAQTASVGTVHYMAPEVGSGNYHRGIDIYAMGVMLYEMLLGKVPFEGGSMGEVLMKHLTAQPEIDALPAPFAAVVRKALAKDPRDRYPNVYEMIDDLMDVADVRDSVAGFDPASLSAVARHAPDDRRQSPAPSPNPPPRGVPAITQTILPKPAFDLDARDLPGKLAKQIDATHRKVEKRLQKLASKRGYGKKKRDKKAGRKEHRSDPPQVPGPRPESDTRPRTRGETLQRMTLALAMAGGLGLVVGMISGGRPESVVSACLLTAGMTSGLVLGCRAYCYLARHRAQPMWLERVTLAIFVTIPAFLFVIPFADTVRPHGQGMLAGVGLLLATLVLNWRKRVERGTEGQLTAGYAVTAGIVGCLATAFLTEGHDRSILLVGGVMASTSLVLQAVAWLFPLQEWLSGAPVRVNLDRMLAEDEHARSKEPERSRWLHPWRGRSAEVGSSPDPVAESATPTGSAEPFLIDGAASSTPDQHVARRRWLLTRMLGGLFAFSASVAGVVALMTLVDGSHTVSSITVDEFSQMHITRVKQAMPADTRVRLAAAVAACAGLAWIGMRKTARWRRGGFYREWLRPVMITGTLIVATASIAAITHGVAQREGAIAAGVLLIVSLLSLVCLLLARGRRWPLPDDQAETRPEAAGSEPDETLATPASS